jgi:hypothetical protein
MMFDLFQARDQIITKARELSGVKQSFYLDQPDEDKNTALQTYRDTIIECKSPFDSKHIGRRFAALYDNLNFGDNRIIGRVAHVRIFVN